MTTSTESTFNVPQILFRNWWFVLSCAAVSASIASIYALKAPNWYSASISVVPLQPTQYVAAQPSEAPVGGEAVSAIAQRIQAVLTSASVADEVIDKFKLEDRYRVENRDAARIELWKHCGASVAPRSGIVSLSCEDLEPRVAKEMAAWFGEVGNRVFRRVSASSATEERKFLEAQVVATRRDVDEASRKLREFQRAHNVIDLPEQSKAVISAMAAIKGEILSKELELSYSATFASESESNVAQARRQIGILSSKLRQLEVASTTARADFFPPAATVADMRFELEQLTRDQKIAETLFFSLTQRFEMAKVDEARDTSTFQILDRPTQPAIPSRPHRMRITMLGGFVGVTIACVLLVLGVWWRRQPITWPPKGAST
jgi:uncharacterized protein involved in exopolysaccharide biosynthesis